VLKKIKSYEIIKNKNQPFSASTGLFFLSNKYFGLSGAKISNNT